MLGLVGTKKGMTRVFKDDGRSIPVTVVEVFNSKIVQRKTQESDGYFAIQVSYGKRKKVSKSNEKKFKDNGTDKGYLTEFNLSEDEFNEIASLNEISLKSLQNPKVVDVLGVSKGKGFAGVVKRHNFKTQDATHGNSLSHRAPGSIGQCQFPGRVFKGKKMSGQMGNKNVTIQNLEIDSIDLEDNLILIQGSIPGSVGSIVKILPSIKNQDEKFTLASGDNIDPKDEPKEAAAPEEAPEEAPKEEPKEAAAPEEAPKEEPKEEPKEAAAPEEAPKEEPKEEPKDNK